MYAIYGNMYHQYTPNVSIYTSTMDHMGYMKCFVSLIIFRKFVVLFLLSGVHEANLKMDGPIGNNIHREMAISWGRKCRNSRVFCVKNVEGNGNYPPVN